MKKIIKTLTLASVVAVLSACSSSSEEEVPANTTVYFPVNGYAVEEQYTQSLDAEATYLKANPTVQVEVQGYTDKTGTEKYNMALGQRRANSVKKYLVQQGVSSKQITTKSFGPANPVNSGDTPEDLSQNRRVYIAR